MLNVVCVRAGTRYGADYVKILADMVRRNLPEGMAGRFICFTDQDDDLGPDIGLRSLPGNLKGWWNKLYLFKDGLFENGDRILYFDLDTVLTGPLDEIAAYDGPFAILRDFYRPGGLQSSVMAWPANTMGRVWEAFVKQRFPNLDGGDQAFIEQGFWGEKSPDIWQDKFPGSFCSYKVHARWGIPRGTKVVVFHGLPRPSEAGGWVDKIWKIGGGSSAELVTQANVPEYKIKSNILSAEAASNITASTLRWIEQIPAHDGEALICAGGPSLKSELNSLRVHHERGAKIFAVNGVQKFLRSQRIHSHYHVILDARRENIKFVPAQWEIVERLYASQCDPLVLDANGAKVTCWHPAIDGIQDYISKTEPRILVGGGTTAGMKAVALAYILGFRKLHLYGFDSCYSGSFHHAYPQEMNAGERILDVSIDGEDFRAAPWMIQQVEDFEEFGPQLVKNGCEIMIHGNGMIATAARMMERDAPNIVLPPLLRANEVLKRLNGSAKVAEIGIFAGDMSRWLLRGRDDLELTMVDCWSSEKHAQPFFDSEDFHSTLTNEGQEVARQMAMQAVEFAKDRTRVLHTYSLDAANMVEDESLDLVFVDADHSYEGCSADCVAWFPKVKVGGYIGGHDYSNDEFKFGQMVKRAVDEFVAENSLKLELGDNFTWFARKDANGLR